MLRIRKSVLMQALALFVFATTLGKAFHAHDRFNYRETDEVEHNYGPDEWGEVDCHDVESCPGWPTNWEELNPFIPYEGTDNMCRDCSERGNGVCAAHKQSPIHLYRNVTGERECHDRHRMNYIPGNCKFEEMNFEILPHVLRAYQPEYCSVRPNIDYSMGFPQPWHLSFTDVSIPSQHTMEGKQYDAELVLSHVYSPPRYIENRLIGNVAIMLEKGEESDHYDFLELYIRAWLDKERMVRESCARRKLQKQRKPQEEESHLRGQSSSSSRSERKPRDLMAEDEGPQMIDTEWYTGKFNPYNVYLKTRTEYYFRYEGSMPEPPCFETVHWRVLKDPVKISPTQLETLQQLLINRLDPETCEPETAAVVKKRPGKVKRQKMGLCKHIDPATCRRPTPMTVDVTRPIQTTTNAHRLVFCECVDWESHYRAEREWCELPMEERGVFPLPTRAPISSKAAAMDGSTTSTMVSTSEPTTVVSSTPSAATDVIDSANPTTGSIPTESVTTPSSLPSFGPSS